MKEAFIIDALKKYSSMVKRIAFQNLKNMDDAEEIAQEVFIKLVKKYKYNDEEHLKAWLIRVTVNMCKDRRMLFENMKTEPLNDEYPCFTEDENSIIEELWKLPAKYRNTLYLYYYEGYSVPEISGILKKNEHTVSSWLTRARKNLKIILLEEGGYDHEQQQ